MKKLPIALFPLLALAACSPSGGSDSSADIQTVPSVSNTTEMTLEERGARIYKRCRACHTLDAEGRHKVGPNLWAIYGRQAGSKEGYAYSKAMLGSGIVWDAETMDAYLTKPATYVKGTKMSFIGLKNQTDRDAVQAYMRLETTP